MHFELAVAEKDLAKAETEGLEKAFKLVGQINTSNMICFDMNGKIRKYKSPEEILEEFYTLRLSFYQKRKVCMSILILIDWVSNYESSNTCATNWSDSTSDCLTKLGSCI